ncbi:MAG: hypothetical protein BGN98_13760 [Microbacterium sp. 69-7]|uniref:hypothetical protein n=1 Tax=Microbacterium sp. 69-7 TaxID=1895784 RepID=UPI00095D1485|nr:hypothetical protein [Microbacterium sp. 69-7]OJU44446.1 MAG: hypothetical protein BGN98_13760 [Microbacterium sp. 69-7]
MTTITQTAETPIGQAVVSIEIDWNDLGRTFGGASSTDQTDFLIGMTQEFRSWGGKLESSLQAALIARAFESESPEYAVHVAELLRMLADAIGTSAEVGK